MSPSPKPVLRLEYVRVPSGRMHVATAGDAGGDPLVLLHQTPRCWEEYSAVLPLLEDYRLIVPDLPGHGGSSAVLNTIEAQAAAVLELLDALGATRVHLVGHHFGGLVCYELAAQAPERIRSVVFSSTPYIDQEERLKRQRGSAFDAVPVQSDGRHLITQWQRRSEYLAEPGRAEHVLSRHIGDVLRHTEPDRGHDAVAAYASEQRLGRYPGPVLCVASAKNPRAFARRSFIRGAFPQAREVIIEEGDIATPETSPHEFAATIRTFHASLGSGRMTPDGRVS